MASKKKPNSSPATSDEQINRLYRQALRSAEVARLGRCSYPTPWRRVSSPRRPSHAQALRRTHHGGDRLHIVASERIGHGQILWSAIDVNDPPHRKQTAADTRMTPVILNLFHPDELTAIMDRSQTWTEIRRMRMVRLCNEAHTQGGLLSGVDLSLLLGAPDSTIGTTLAQHEKQTNTVIPRRATVHDMGSGVTHKRIICRKRFLEGKDPQQVARETHHTLEAVDRYLGQYDRVRHCRQQGMSSVQTAHLLSCSERLVREYLEIDDQINEARKKSQPAQDK